MAKNGKSFREKQAERAAASIEKYGKKSVHYKGTIAKKAGVGAYAGPTPAPTPAPAKKGWVKLREGVYRKTEGGVTRVISTQAEAQAAGVPKELTGVPTIKEMVVSGLDPSVQRAFQEKATEREKAELLRETDIARVQVGRKGGIAVRTGEEGKEAIVTRDISYRRKLAAREVMKEIPKTREEQLSSIREMYMGEREYLMPQRVKPREEPKVSVISGLYGRYERAEAYARRKVVAPTEEWLRKKGVTEKQITQSLLGSQYLIPGTGVVTATSSWFRERQKRFIEEQVRGLRYEPVKTAAYGVVAFGLPVVGKGIGALAKATRVTKIPGVSKVTPYITKGLGIGLGAAYVTTKGIEFYQAPTWEARERKVYRAIGTEIIPAGVGVVAGVKAVSKVGGLITTIGKKPIPITKIAAMPETVTVAPKIPTAKQIKISFGKKTLYPKPVRKVSVPRYAELPGEEIGVTYGWHAAPGKFPKVTTTIAGTSELPGLYTSPVLESYFLKVAAQPKYKLFGLDFPTAPSPAGLRIKAKGFEVVPKHIRAKGRKAIEEYLLKARKGKLYAPLQKPEYEAILPPGTPLTRYGARYYTTVKGVRVPLYQYEAGVGKPGARVKRPRVTTAKELYEYYRPRKVSVISPYYYAPSIISYGKRPSYKPTPTPSYKPTPEPSYKPTPTPSYKPTPKYPPKYPPRVPPYRPPRVPPYRPPRVPPFRPPKYPPGVPPRFKLKQFRRPSRKKLPKPFQPTKYTPSVIGLFGLTPQATKRMTKKPVFTGLEPRGLEEEFTRKKAKRKGKIQRRKKKRK